MPEFDARISSRSVRVRDAGDPAGSPVLYFHGTPGSRLDVAFGDEVATQLGVRIVSFDRPGYGRSDPSPYGLERIACDSMAIADLIGLERFATFGWSGGGPFALATSALFGTRVTRVGVASGPAPFQEMPSALATLSDDDRAALSFLPEDPARAAEAFRAGSPETAVSLEDEKAFMSVVDALFAGTDAGVLDEPILRRHLFVMLSEGLRQGFGGVAWDNVAWVGAWDVNVAATTCPIHLWYGERDVMIPVEHGRWLAEHLTGAELTAYPGEGHLGPLRHWAAMLQAVTAKV